MRSIPVKAASVHTVSETREDLFSIFSPIGSYRPSSFANLIDGTWHLMIDLLHCLDCEFGQLQFPLPWVICLHVLGLLFSKVLVSSSTNVGTMGRVSGPEDSPSRCTQSPSAQGHTRVNDPWTRHCPILTDWIDWFPGNLVLRQRHPWPPAWCHKAQTIAFSWFLC